MSQNTTGPDTILHGGPILTMEENFPRAEAVASLAGSASWQRVGSKKSSRCGERETELVDLAGQTLLPGLIEPHTHPDLCAQCYSWIDVSGFTHSKVEGVEAALREAVAAASEGEWLYAFGLDPMLTEGVGTWDRDRLDALAPNNPLVVMIQSMHTLFVNSAALREAGVDESTPDPPGGGHFGRDADGRLNGKIEEASAALLFLRFSRHLPRLTARRHLGPVPDATPQAGLTTIGMPGMFVALEMLDVFEELARRDDLPVRMVAYLRHHQVDRVDWKPGEGNDRFRVQGVKLWYDGSPYSGTMLLDDPYRKSRLCCCTLGIPGRHHRARQLRSGGTPRTDPGSSPRGLAGTHPRPGRPRHSRNPRLLRGSARGPRPG